MYGMVNQAIEDLVIETAGEDAWREIKEHAGLAENGFESSVIYDDEVTLSLVAAASEKLKLPPEQILHAFGRHWILYTGREGWSSVFEMTGYDMESFLDGLDEMHARVRVAMSEADTPQFTLHRESDHLSLEYHSNRDGLAPMVNGLLEGLAEHFDEHWSIQHTGQRAEDGFDTFRLRQIATATGSTDAKAA
ncbi:hypothetical protein AB833_22315 [Chromatiales bacterium (ex Bugula neritina AB1)]|nr:hypothetical protein AB833_22315 [Chromatiales bacterium (ex Bugula neritina AB1)]